MAGWERLRPAEPRPGLAPQALSLRGATAPVVIAPVVSVPATLVRDTTAVAAGAAPVVPSVSNPDHWSVTMMRVAQLKTMAACVAVIALVTRSPAMGR